MKNKICIVCGRNFERPRNVSYKNYEKRRFCSLKCFGATTRKNRLCPLCKKPVQNRNNKKYCSWNCAKLRPELRRKKGDHQSWKGGRSIDPSGYVRVRIYEENPYYSMRLQHGYVQEHRLVMAEMMGRPLEDYETVHHKNGIRDDNRKENLELRTGRHGKGATKHCLTCTCKQ